jgi:hypothetical protein
LGSGKFVFEPFDLVPEQLEFVLERGVFLAQFVDLPSEFVSFAPEVVPFCFEIRDTLGEPIDAILPLEHFCVERVFDLLACGTTVSLSGGRTGPIARLSSTGWVSVGILGGVCPIRVE